MNSQKVAHAPKSKLTQKVEPIIIDCGILSDAMWPGPVSAKALITAGLTTPAALQQAVKSLNDFYVPVNAQARTRCIDGRHDPELDELTLVRRYQAVHQVQLLPTGWGLIKTT